MNINDEEFKNANYKNANSLEILYNGDKSKKFNAKMKEDEIFCDKEYYISQIKAMNNNKKNIYIFKIRDDKNIFKSNTFFEQEYNKITNELFKMDEIKEMIKNQELSSEYIEKAINKMILNGEIFIKFKVGVKKADSNKNYNNMIVMNYFKNH